MSIKKLTPTRLLAALTVSLAINSTVLANDKIPVVASFSILGDLVAQVGGEHISLITLVKENGDAHVYSPTPKDALAVKKAQLLVVNGLNFEGWLPRLLESAHFQGTQVIASNGINTITIGEHHNAEHDEHHDGADHDEHHDDADHDEHHDDADHDEHHSDADHDEHHDDADHDDADHDDHHGDADHEMQADHHGHNHQGIDPHAWNSITNVKVYIHNIEQGLTKVDPQNGQYYKDNAQLYLKKLTELEAKLHAKIDLIPEDQRKVITPHDAFAYLSRDFHIQFIAPQGTSTESEASAADMANIIKQIRRENINAVFLENIADNRMVEQISRETDAQIGGKLFTGALSDQQGAAPTYLQLMQYNVDTIVNALTK